MDSGVYAIVYKGLHGMDDIPEMSRKYHIPNDVLEAILTQKIVRDVKSRYHAVKLQAPKLLKRWESGETFLQISEGLGFSPVMTASLILQQRGLTKKQFSLCMKNPEKLGNPRILRELKEAMRNDPVYSPHGTMRQVVKGKLVEEKIQKWLLGRKIGFRHETEVRKEHKKTPDFLLDMPLTLENRKVHWVECKASFGDTVEIKRDHRKQLRHYVELFGSGAVVYWYGFLDGQKFDKILIKSKNLLMM